VTVQAQEFPVTPIRWVVLVVVVLMMYCEFAEFLPAKLPATKLTRQNGAEGADTTKKGEEGSARRKTPALQNSARKFQTPLPPSRSL
jgi:hypothetical protein